MGLSYNVFYVFIFQNRIMLPSRMYGLQIQWLLKYYDLDSQNNREVVKNLLTGMLISAYTPFTLLFFFSFTQFPDFGYSQNKVKHF